MRARRLSELMFVDVVRHYLETLPATAWVGSRVCATRSSGGRSRHSIAILHPVDHRVLGKERGLSRSALAERFTQFVGQPPMHYLMNWRMQTRREPPSKRY